MSREITTPCIGVCSTIYGDDICRGCHRSYDEIIEWNALSLAKKSSILDRLEKLQIKHCSAYLHVSNKKLLLTQLNKLNIRFRDNCDPIALAYQLFRQDTSNISLGNLQDFGICLNKNLEISHEESLNNIITKIDEAVYKDSEQNLAQANTTTTGE